MGKSFKQINQVICDFYAGGKSESGLRPYLEVLKIQFDLFGEKDIPNSRYMQAFIQIKDDLLEKYET